MTYHECQAVKRNGVKVTTGVAELVQRGRAIAFLLFCFAAHGVAADFKTLDGTRYSGVAIKRVEADGIVVQTGVGVSKIYFTELPAEMRERYSHQAASAAASPAVVATGASAEGVAVQPAAAPEYASTAVDATASTVHAATAPIAPVATPAQAAPPLHTYELKQDYAIGGDTGTVVKRLSKGQRYRGRDLPDGIQLEIDGKPYTVPRDILSPAKD